MNDPTLPFTISPLVHLDGHGIGRFCGLVHSPDVHGQWITRSGHMGVGRGHGRFSCGRYEARTVVHRDLCDWNFWFAFCLQGRVVMVIVMMMVMVVVMVVVVVMSVMGLRC